MTARQTAKVQEAKTSDFHVRFGGFQTFSVKSYASEDGARSGCTTLLEHAAVQEFKFNQDQSAKIRRAMREAFQTDLPVEGVILGGPAPIVFRVWKEVRTKVKPNSSTLLPIRLTALERDHS